MPWRYLALHPLQLLCLLETAVTAHVILKSTAVCNREKEKAMKVLIGHDQLFHSMSFISCTLELVINLLWS